MISILEAASETDFSRSKNKSLTKRLLFWFHSGSADESLEALPNNNLERKNWLSGLSDDFIAYIVLFIEQPDQIQLRSCNKALLESVGTANNHEFMQVFKPKVHMGYEAFETNKLAGIFLFPYAYHLKDLLNSEHVVSKISDEIDISKLSTQEQDELEEITGSLSNIDNFGDFMMTSIRFYLFLDPVFAWHLIEASVKAGLFGLDDLNFITNVNLQKTFEISCELGLIKLNHFLRKHYLKELIIIEGYGKCLKGGKYRFYEELIKVAKNEKLLTDADLHRMMEEASQTFHSQFLRIIFDNFPHLTRQNSNCIFIAVRNRNIPVIEVILEYRGQADLLICNSDRMSAFDLAAKIDFWDGIHLMSRALKETNIDIFVKGMIYAICYGSTKSFIALMGEINNFGPFYTFVNKMQILKLINVTIELKKLEIAELLLKNSPSDILKCNENQGPFDILLKSLGVRPAFFYPIFYSIKLGYLDGFFLLFDYYGLELLELRDSDYRTPILMAAHCGNSAFVKVIVSLDSNQTLQKDAQGNNVLHLALKTLDDPIPFIKEVLDIDFDWDQQNNFGESAIDIFAALPLLSTEDLRLVYNNYISKQLA